MSDETNKSPTSSNNTPALRFYGSKARVKFTVSCLKQDNFTYSLGKTVNIYIVYKLSAFNSHTNYPTLKNSLIDALKLTKNADINKYNYSDYQIGFDRKGSFSFPVLGSVKM